MKLNELRDEIHENAKNKGFYDVVKDGFDTRIKVLSHAFFAQQIALIHSELSEAIEVDRLNKKSDMTSFGNLYNGSTPVMLRKLDREQDDKYYKHLFEEYIKNSIEDELADVIIRVLDLCGYLNINVEKHVEMKMRYNELRECKHGKDY